MVSTTKLPSKFFFSSDHSWPGLLQVLSHVFLRRVKDEEVVGGAGERGEVGGVQLQADQQDLPGRQEAGLLKPQGEPTLDEFDPGENVQMVLKVMEPWTAGCQIVALNYQVLL